MKTFLKALLIIIIVLALIVIIVPRIVSHETMTLDDAAKKFAKGKFITIDGKKTHYIEKGAGKPLILIHGYMYNSIGWSKNIEPLAKKFKVYAIDVWGHGYSERLKDMSGYTFAGFAKQVIGFMDALKIKSAYLAGHSMGGGIVTYTTAHYPDRVDGAILVGASVLPHVKNVVFKLINVPYIGEFVSTVFGDSLFKATLKQTCYNDPNWLTDEYFEEIRRPLMIKGSQAAALYLARNLFQPPQLTKEADMLAKMDKPILLVHGVGDGLVPVSDSKELHKMWKASKLVIIDNGKHNVQEEHADTFNKLVEDFISK